MRFLNVLLHNTFWGLMFMSSMFALSTVSQGEPVERSLPVNSPTFVMQSCEIVPEGVFPTGVVLQRIGGSPDIWAGTWISRNPKAVDRGLDVALDGAKWDGMRVLHFCK